MVHAALAALVPLGNGVWNAGAGIGAGMDDVLAAVVPHRVLLHCDALADRDHSFGELYVLELFGAVARVLAAGRSTFAAVFAGALEEQVSQCAACETRGGGKH